MSTLILGHFCDEAAAMVMRSAKTEAAECAQHDPHHTGVCWFNDLER